MELATTTTTSFVDDDHPSITGQAHDRIHGDGLIPGVEETIAMEGDNGRLDIDVEITAGQKMISAMSGSLLTSLLGMP